MILHNGDCLEMLKSLDANSVDSLVCDPPAGIAFMGKSWDTDKGGRDHWIAWMRDVMSECIRVMKPGAHGLVWALPRTSHWTATALEDAGFEIRDVITHLFGSGFPKSHNIEKATGDKKFVGWGTALKPASEHWILIRKPCSEKTVAANVLKWGCGAINIDASRVSTNGKVIWKVPPTDKQSNSLMVYDKPGLGSDSMFKNKGDRQGTTLGRFPANLLLSCSPLCTEDAHDMFECPIALLDEQSGILKSGDLKKDQYKDGKKNQVYGQYGGFEMPERKGDTGCASRFFYCAKASKSDKGKANTHPTVKSTKLMSYLITMVTPPNGIVLDPFMGSGSTGVAAKRLGFSFIGIEKENEYFEIAKARINALN